MAFTSLLMVKERGVATLTLNRPAKSNAFDETLTAEFLEALIACERDPEVRCIVVTGAGRHFCAGQDLGVILERYDRSEVVDYRRHLLGGYNRMVLQLRSLAKPVIAAVNGAAAGAGLGLACACDLRFASEEARFRMAFIGIGLAPDSATSFFLPRLVGLGRATEMAFTNQPVEANTALQYGLVNRVFPAADLLPRTREFAQMLAQAPTRAIGLTKRAFERALAVDTAGALDYEAFLQQVAGGTVDHREGVRAFLEKRSPVYQGR